MQGKHLPGKRAVGPESGGGMSAAGKAALILLISIVTLAIGGAVGIGVYANHIYEGVFPGVSVAGIALDGQTLPGAQNLLTQQLGEELDSRTVTVTADGEDLGTYTLMDLGARPHAAQAALKAYAVGREKGTKGWINNGLTMAKALLGYKVNLTSAWSYDEAKLFDIVDQMAESFDTEGSDAFYEMGSDGLYATKERSGRTLDRDALARMLYGAEGTVEAPWTKVPGQSLDLQAMADEISSEALPTRYDIATGTVLEGQMGVTVDLEAAQYLLEAVEEGERVKLPAEVTYPKMTAEELEALLFRDLLSTATTSVSGTSVRKGNVRLSGELVNGTILNHGDVFDYNRIVGERTEERGFGKASAYRNGETVQELGGGICQTSSTIYYAVLLANLEIVDRANHRYTPGYIEMGMDATVSWDGPEFRFRNDTGYPIRIEVAYEKDKLTVNIYGTKLDDTYVVMTSEITSTTPYNTVYEETMDLSWGTKKVKQSGYTGYKVTSYRNVYDGDGNLISKNIESKSVYSSRDEIVLVGIKGRPANNGGETNSGTDTGANSGGETNSGADTGTNSGGETNSGADTGASSGGETNSGTDTGASSGGETNSGTDTGTSSGGETNSGNDSGSGAGSDPDPDPEEPTIPDNRDQQEEEPGIIDPEDEMPDWLRP